MLFLCTFCILIKKSNFSFQDVVLDVNISWDMTFGFVYPKDYIVSWILPVVAAPCKNVLAFFWLIMSWRVGFSFRCFTAPIANPFTFSFPNTSWNNVHRWAGLSIVISIVLFSPATISCLDSVMITWWRTPLNLIFLADLFPQENSVIKFLLQSEAAQYQQARANS